MLQRVPETRVGKNQVHIDLAGEEPRAAAVARLTLRGASLITEHQEPGSAWTVMADPEGNQFCVR